MKQLVLAIVFACVFSCSPSTNYTKAEDAQDAGREFIRASLDGDVKKARFYLLKDSANLYLLEKWKTDLYDKLVSEDRVAYREASILPVRITTENDSTVRYIFSNSFKKDTTAIKIVKVHDEWLVDLKDIHGSH
ncbi:MAG TPA: hypothetical protein VM012_09790 [Flavitalea sp.]|nr:hypothetical protein [Flavitalea sp.]